MGRATLSRARAGNWLRSGQLDGHPAPARLDLAAAGSGSRERLRLAAHRELALAALLACESSEADSIALDRCVVVDLPLAEPLIGSSEALAIKKGEQQMLNFLNAWVTARKSDKWLLTTHDYWFSTLDWLQDVAP